METSLNTPAIPCCDSMWRSVRIACEPGFEDIISSCIFDSGFSGLEEHSANGKTIFTAYHRQSPENDDSIEMLTKALEDSALRTGVTPALIISDEDVPNEDWELSWRKGLGFIEIGSRLIVRPSWVKYSNPDERLEIIIDPKMAFGTGSHETTRLCLDLIEKKSLSEISVLDAGCGSGVLSIAAVKLGARCAIGFDNNTDSVGNALINIRINRVVNRVTIYEAGLTAVMPGRFDLVLANMMSSELIPNLGRFHDFLLPGGEVIFSGLLEDEEDSFCRFLAKEGFGVSEVNRMGEWIAVVCDIG